MSPRLSGEEQGSPVPPQPHAPQLGPRAWLPQHLGAHGTPPRPLSRTRGLGPHPAHAWTPGSAPPRTGHGPSSRPTAPTRDHRVPQKAGMLAAPGRGGSPCWHSDPGTRTPPIPGTPHTGNKSHRRATDPRGRGSQAQPGGAAAETELGTGTGASPRPVPAASRLRRVPGWGGVRGGVGGAARPYPLHLCPGPAGGGGTGCREAPARSTAMAPAKPGPGRARKGTAGAGPRRSVGGSVGPGAPGLTGSISPGRSGQPAPGALAEPRAGQQLLSAWGGQRGGSRARGGGLQTDTPRHAAARGRGQRRVPGGHRSAGTGRPLLPSTTALARVL